VITSRRAFGIPIPDELAALLRLWRDKKPKSNIRVVGPLMFPLAVAMYMDTATCITVSGAR
jgi:hypothetical protein